MSRVEHLCKARVLVERHWMCAKNRNRDGDLFYTDKETGRLSSKPRTIWRALYDTHPDFNAVRDVHDLLMDLAGRTIREWEDSKDRTKQDVLDLFDRAIAAVAPAKEYAPEP